MRFCVIIMLALLSSAGLPAAELKPQTIAAFDRYVRLTEDRMAAELTGDRFLAVDRVPAAARQARLAELANGGLVIDRVETRDGQAPIDVPDGIIHHWSGVVFVPGETVDRAVALLQDYNRHDEIYQPAVARSELLSREGDRFRVFLRFFTKKVIAVTVNSEHDAAFTRVDATRAYSRIVSTRIAEVENAGTRSEKELPIGNDGGYLWRLNSYWRFLARDGGTYVQCESISLTRGIPTGLGWVVGPFVTSVPRESLTFTLETTRKALAQGR